MFSDTATPLPDWLTHVDDAPGTYMADPNIFYPAILHRMGVDVMVATQYDLEVALGLAKRYAMWVAGQGDREPCRHLIIMGNDGRKAKWRISNFPNAGRPDISSPGAAGRRNAAVDPWWKKLMGPIVK